MNLASLKEKITNVSEDRFEKLALEIFNFQAQNNNVYSEFIKCLEVDITNVQELTQIPFLPIEFFKSKIVKTGNWKESMIYKSSGTTNTNRSQHFIEDVNFYHKLSIQRAESYFESLKAHKVIALLPSYIEKGDSSLISMIDYFINQIKNDSHFHHGDYKELIKELKSSTRKVLFVGVTYALLELAEHISNEQLTDLTVLETGGMKGRHKEITPMELHEKLLKSFKVKTIHTEYGMTELLSQAYGSNGQLRFGKTALPLVRELNDPFAIKKSGSGALNIIDLANVHSCSFIETQDLVEVNSAGIFKIKGRMDNSDIRGCSLLF